jgi:hypothetical protein
MIEQILETTKASSVTPIYVTQDQIIKQKNIPHRDDVLHLAAKGHAILPKANGILPFAGTVMGLERFLHSRCHL